MNRLDVLSENTFKLHSRLVDLERDFIILAGVTIVLGVALLVVMNGNRT